MAQQEPFNVRDGEGVGLVHLDGGDQCDAQQHAYGVVVIEQRGLDRPKGAASTAGINKVSRCSNRPLPKRDASEQRVQFPLKTGMTMQANVLAGLFGDRGAGCIPFIGIAKIFANPLIAEALVVR